MDRVLILLAKKIYKNITNQRLFRLLVLILLVDTNLRFEGVLLGVDRLLESTQSSVSKIEKDTQIIKAQMFSVNDSLTILKIRHGWIPKD